MTTQQNERALLIQILRTCADDPMWADHAEISKVALRKAAALLEADAKGGEAQAQGDPEVVLTVVKENDYWSGGHFHEGKKPTIHSWDVRNIPIGTQLIPLQSHREALAQHRAALVACVGALKLAMHWAGPAMERDMRSPSNSQWMVEKTQAQEDSIYAAITQANELLEGGGK